MNPQGCFTSTLRYGTAFLLACLFAAILFPIIIRSGDRHRSYCQPNLKQIGLGIFQYTQDYDERYPIVSVNDSGVTDNNPHGWADALQPYLKSTMIFQCTEENDSAHDKKPTESGYTDYWYNARLNGLEQKNARHVASTLMLGDGNDGTDATNARYSLKELPAAWRTDSYSPAMRHFEGANYSFADGHVKWLKPEKISGQTPKPNVATFAVK